MEHLKYVIQKPLKGASISQ